LSYEQNSSPGDWVDRTLLVSGQGWYPGGTNTEWTSLMSSSLQLNYGVNLTVQTLTDTLNQGVGSVEVMTHGSPAEWELSSQERFTSDDANRLTNSNKLFVVFSDGCHTGKWDANPSLPVSLLTNPGGGAVAVVAGTDYTPYGIEVAETVYDVSKNNPVVSNRLPDADGSIGVGSYYFTSLNSIVNYMNILGDPTLVIPLSHSGNTTTTTTLTNPETSTSTNSNSTRTTSTITSSEDSSSQTPSQTPSSIDYPPKRCIIATAAYGSDVAPDVVYMRHVRDDMIGSSPTGRILRDAWNTFYYSWSPPIAGVIALSSILQAVFRTLLLPLVGIIHITAFVFTALGSGDSASIVWGTGSVDGLDSDIWLDRFIRERENEYSSLNDFAILLQNELRNHLLLIDVAKSPGGTIGFHLAGFVESGTRASTFYHIHNGRSQKLEMRGEIVDGSVVNANHDISPEEGRRIQDSGGVYVVHNGDYHIYKEVFDYLHNFFGELEKKTKGQLLLPYSACLADRVEWLRFQMATISALYNFAGLRTAAREIVKLPTIGGPITTLAILRLDGRIESYSTRY